MQEEKELGMETALTELARGLERLPIGLEAEPEIVRWMRAASPGSIAVPAPAQRRGTRAYGRTLIHRCERFEVLVLHWDPGAPTLIHDHGGALCWLAIASGEMLIENFRRCDDGATPGYARISFEGRASMGSGQIDYRQDDVNLHRCIAGAQGAVTLHLYAHPLDEFKVFDERAERCAPARAQYDAIL